MKIFLSIILSIFIFFAIGESFSRYLLSNWIRYDIEMTKYASTLKKREPLKDYLFTHHPNREEELMGTVVNTNSFGLRDKEFTLASLKKKYRMAFVGDSLTFGWGVDKDKTFEELFEKNFEGKDLEVINLGHGNYNTQQEVSLLESHIDRFDFNHVVLFYFLNDAEESQVSSNFHFLNNSMFISLMWSSVRRIFPNIFFEHKSFVDFYKNLYREDAKGWINTKKALLKVKKICSIRNIPLQVVILPELHNVKNYPFVKEHEKIINYLNSININVVDIRDRFVNIEDSMSLWVAKDDAHPNARAHKIISDSIKDFIKVEMVNE